MQKFLDQLLPLLRGGHLAEAEKFVASHQSGDPALHALGLSAIALRRRDADAALQHAARAHALSPDAAEPLEHLAMASLAAGDADEAERYARQAVDRDPGRRSLVGLGNILLGNNKAAPAEEAYRRALSEAPTDAQALNGVATALHRQRDFDGALRFFAQAFEANPLDPAPIRSLMNMYAEAGRLLGAIAAANLVRERPHTDEEHIALDVLLLQLTRLLMSEFPGKNVSHDADEAVSRLITTAGRRPPLVRLGVARALVDVQRFEEAARMIAAIEKGPLADADRGNLLYVKGLIAAARGDVAGALSQYRAALDADPARWDACSNAVSLLLDRDDAAAPADIEALLDRVPASVKQTSPALLLNEAVFWRKTGRAEAAHANLQAVLSLTGDAGDLARIARELLSEK